VQQTPIKTNTIITPALTTIAITGTLLELESEVIPPTPDVTCALKLPIELFIFIISSPFKITVGLSLCKGEELLICCNEALLLRFKVE
jgi:hypothetical protein